MMIHSKNCIKITFGLIIISIFSFTVTSANFSLIGDYGNQIIKSFNYNQDKSNNHIHFVDNGNDFGGFLWFSDNITETGDYEFKVNADQSHYKCSTKLKGFYYNAERGERVRPLDDNIANKLDMQISINGGFYTNCYNDNPDFEAKIQSCINEQKGDDPNDTTDENNDIFRNQCLNLLTKEDPGYRGIYGQITHTYKSREYVLVAGVEYKQKGHWIEIKNNTKLAPTFQKYDNKYPVGFVYDREGGIGFVGCEFSGNNKQTSLNKILNYIEDGTGIDAFFIDDIDNPGEIMRNDTYTGVNLNCSNIGAVQDTLGLVIEGLIGMGTDTDLITYRNDSSDSKMQYFASVNLNNATLINYAKQKSELLCRGRWNNGVNNSDILCISGSYNDITAYQDQYLGKTIIAKNTNVIISPNNNTPYDIFVDGGNLYLTNDNENNYKVFTNKGFVSSTNISDFKNKETDFGDDIAAANLIKGNLIINGYITGYNNQEIKYKYFIHGKFTSLDTINTLKSTFTRRCAYGEGTTDGFPCSSSNNSYYNAPLIVINQDFDSKIFK